MCGNYHIQTRVQQGEQGSPPRVRELQELRHRRPAQPGITPACAGITLLIAGGDRVHQDHPRVCGNYPVLVATLVLILGSPPRVRELPRKRFSLIFVQGITPACAGITKRGNDFDQYPEDHPRVCGNYFSSSFEDSIHSGSPPRVRELPIKATITIPTARITPACAGITKPALVELDGT